MGGSNPTPLIRSGIQTMVYTTCGDFGSLFLSGKQT
jgi:hypothetical protein